MPEEVVRRSRRTRRQREMFSGLEAGEDVLDLLRTSDMESSESDDMEAQVEDDYVGQNAVREPRMKRAKRAAESKAETHASHASHAPTSRRKETSSTMQPKAYTEGSNALFEALLDYEASLEVLVLDWISAYEQEPRQALLELINAILKCCGCDQMINMDHLADQDSVADTLYEIQEISRANLTRDYPIISKSNAFKGFKKQLTDFFYRFIDQIALTEHLYNSLEIIEQLQTWVIAMSSSTFRSFRHTSTVISLTTVSSLCDVFNRVSKEEHVANKQYEAEKKKKYSNEERINVIKTKISRLEKQMEFLKTGINDFFDSVFVHRYRDVDARIRSDCVYALGLWMIKLPSVFFDGTYLRYLGWVLSDISPLTRLEVLKALTKLYSNNQFIAGLRHFTERFKPRLIEMALHEVDQTIRCSSISLLNEVRLRGFLEDDEINLISTLLFDMDSKIRKKACPFFLSKVEELYDTKIQEIGDPMLKKTNGLQNNNPELNKILWIKYKTIAEVLVLLDETADDINSSNKENIIVKNYNNTKYLDITLDSKPESRMHLVSMTICSEVEELKNWEILAEYLLCDHIAVSSEHNLPKDHKSKFYQMCAPVEKEEIVLLQILYACVYMDIFSSDYNIKSKKKLSSFVKDEHEESISRILLELVPSLLKKYNSSIDASASVLRLEQLMKLDVYQQFRQNKTYENLLDLIGKQFLKHPNSLVMREATSSLLKAQQFDELSSITQEKITEIQEELVNELKSIRSNENLKRSHLSSKLIENLTIVIKRLDHMSSISDCIKVFESESFSVISVLLEIVERVFSFDENELEMIIGSLRTLKWLYIWKAKHLMDHKDNISSEEFNVIIVDRNKLFDLLYMIIESKEHYKIRYHAISVLVDLYVVFSNFKMINIIDNFDETIFIIPQKVQNIIISSLNYYIKQYIKFNGSKDVELLTDEETDQEFEDDDGEKTALVLERCMCEITGKVVLAILNGVMDRKHILSLVKNKDKLGLSYNHVIAELDVLKANGKTVEG